MTTGIQGLGGIPNPVALRKYDDFRTTGVVRYARLIWPKQCKRLTWSGASHHKSMSKKTEQWLLFKYIDGQFTPLSKPFKTREQAEEQRQKYPERERKGILVGVIRS